ncbi:MAG: peptidylprolyl isomerase [Acidobacteriales bacterium]|nr:peptidylprolyl isomerase [Terriglobales bacterium]
MPTIEIRGIAGVALLAGVLLLPAQTPNQTTAPAHPPAAKPIGPDDVVATINGEKITPHKIQAMRQSLPPQFQQAVSRMDEKAFLKSYAELLVMSQLAEKNKVAEHDPYRSQFAFLRMNFLAQAYLDYLNKNTPVSQDEYKRYYDEHKTEFQEASVRTIYVAFSPNASAAPSSDPKAKKPLTEEQAKAKAESLWGKLKKGADFAKLAEENSDDKASAEKGGDIGLIKGNSGGVPGELKTLIFNLKASEISVPLRQPAGFYIFKVESTRTIPYEEAVVLMAPTVQGIRVKEELDKIIRSIQITYDNEAFFNPDAPAAPAPPKPPAGPEPLK